MIDFSHKLVAILNKELPSGVALNALAHMTIGLGAQFNKEILRLNDYVDATGNTYPNISQMPFIILRGKSNEIRKVLVSAHEKNISQGAFVHTMTGGTYLEQLANTAQTSEEQLTYYGCVLFGPTAELSALTKKFSLWKD